MKKINNESTQRRKYPWKSFLIFAFIYLVGLAAYYPNLLTQAKAYIEIFGEGSAVTATQLAGFSLIQPFLFGVVAIYFGSRYIQRINLRSLIVDYAERADTWKFFDQLVSFKKSIPMIVVFSAVIALMNLGFDFVFQNWLPEAFQPNYIIPDAAQILSTVVYSGLGQEILLRYGIMTTVIYVVSSRGKDLNRWVYIIGIVFTAVVFAIARYNTIIAAYGLHPVLLLRLILLTVLDGFLYGTLYYKFQVEASMLAHMLANVLVIAGNILIVWMAG